MKTLNTNIEIKRIGSDRVEYTLKYYFDKWTNTEKYVIINNLGFGVYSGTSLSKCKKVLNEL